MLQRVAKDNAKKALRDNQDSMIVEDSPVENLNNDKNIHINSETHIPIITQNAPRGFALDLVKQYSRRADYCDRQLIKIHDRSQNKKDQGSEDKGLIYIDFKAGMFEALKVNFVRCLENYNTKLISEPKIEMYGEALERVCIDLQMQVGEHSHDV